jgi:hypothetical protein
MSWSQDAYADTLPACTTPPDSPRLRYFNCYMSMTVPFPSRIPMHSLQESTLSTPTFLDLGLKSTSDGEKTTYALVGEQIRG